MDWTNEPLNWTSGQIVSESDMDDHVTQCFYDLKIIQMLEAAEELTIAAGVITVTRSHNKIDTEADAATDNLTTISGGVEGDIIYLRPVSAARVTTLVNGTGAGALYLGQDIALDSVTKYVALIHNGTGWSLYGYTDLTGNTLTQTLTNKTLTSPTINGTIGTTGLTLPAITLGGAVTGNAQNISGLGTIAGVSLATSAAIPLLLTNAQLVNIALTAQTVAATTLTIPDFASVVDEFTFKTKSQTMANKTLTSPTINGTIATTGLTMPAFTLGGAVTGTGIDIDAAILDTCVGKGTWTASGTWTIPAVTLGGTVTTGGSRTFVMGAGILTLATTGAGVGLSLQSTNDGSEGFGITFTHISTSPAVNDYIQEIYTYANDSAGNLTQYGFQTIRITDPTDTTESAKYYISLMRSGTATIALEISGAGILSAITGITPAASSKINPVSGVAGFSVVSTALTLGSLGSVLIPQSNAACTDALAGNIDGCIGINATEDAEAFYFRANAEWYYINKTGGLSMTKEERIDPNGHEFKIGDTVKLIVDKIRPDGSFHAIPYLGGA